MFKGLRFTSGVAGAAWMAGATFGVWAIWVGSWSLATLGAVLATAGAWRWDAETRWPAIFLGVLPLALIILVTIQRSI